ncbi:MAG: MFS transporter [Firmicutes bacterium]|nr:MFS transporter [Bacillota bacterium]
MNEPKKGLKTTVIVVILTAFATAFTGSSLNLSIPSIAADFNVSASQLGWMVTAYALAVAAFSVPFGRLADITSHRTILLIGTAIFAACCGISAAAGSFALLLIIRFIQGVGAAMVFSTNTAIIISAFPPEKRGKAIGYSIGGTYVVLASGPVVGGIINQQLGWRFIFIFTGILVLLAVILAAAGLSKGKISDKKRPFDLVGNILFVIFIPLLMFGLSKLMDYGIWAVLMVAAGIAVGVIFVIHESKEPDPAVNVRLFKSNLGFGLSNLSALLNYAVTIALSYLLSIYLQVVQGYSSQTAGLIMVCQPLVMALLAPQFGKLSDRISPFKLSSAGMGLSGIGIIAYIFVDENTSVAVIIIALIFVGAGFAMFSSPNTNAIMSCVDRKDYGVASSLVSTMRTIGQTVGMVIVTLVVTFHLGSTPLASSDPQTVIKVIHISFIIFVIICAIGVVISLQRGKEPSHER